MLPGDSTSVPTVTRDVPCYGCGYNLRTQPLDGDCPECGLAVSETLDPVVIDPDDDDAVRRWRRGLAFLAASAMVTAVGPLIGIILATVAFSTVNGGDRALILSGGWLVFTVVVEQGLWLTGVYRCTRRPHGSPMQRPVDPAGAAWFYAVVYSLVASMWMVSLVAPLAGVYSGLRRWYGLLPIALLFVALIWPVVCLLRLGSINTVYRHTCDVLGGLGQRWEVRRLDRWVKLIRYGIVIFVLAYGLCWLLAIASLDGGEWLMWIGLVMWIGSGVCLNVFAGVMAVKLWRLSRVIGDGTVG